MMSKNNRQVRVETFANAMLKRYRVHMSIPSSGPTDLDALSATLTKLSEGETRTLEDVRLWASSIDTAPDPTVDPPPSCDPLSEEGSLLEVASRLKILDQMLQKLSGTDGVDATIDALINQSIALGRVIERAKTQQKFLAHVEVGKKVKEGGRSGGEMRRGQRAPSTQERLDKMENFLQDGATYSEAARMLFTETNEWTFESNYKLLKRNRK